MAVVEMQGGGGAGHIAHVTQSGEVHTRVKTFEPTADTLPGTTDVSYPAGTPIVVGTTAATILGQNDDRSQLEIQNLSSTNSIHIYFGPVAGSTATYHRRLGPNEVYSFPPGVTYKGPVQGMAVGGAAAIAVHQFDAVA